ncbi:zonular occludens toxin domain-containing protein [Methylobacter tundripaludum]|uniref:zonular occludens toxin domain-containing protein n=1 Tax=Methylobacter tundripaludum TaxID=173365 RepID=UPI0004DF1D50|nr:zonular occludens toxin domain-containing protein [Methylobacter tundripaludum]
MITLITGTPGAGKTAWTVQELTRLPSQRKVFIHGVPELKIAHEPIYCLSDLCDHCRALTEIAENEDGEQWVKVVATGLSAYLVEQWQEWATEGSLIIVDEVQRVWRPSSKVPDEIAALETHRHKGLDFWLISQGPHLFHSNIRLLIGRHIHLVSSWKGRNEYEFPECRQNVSSRGDAVIRPYSLPKKIFHLYKSSSLHTVHKHRKPMSFYLLILVVLISLVLGFYAYQRFSKKFNSEPPSVASVAPAQTQSGLPAVPALPSDKEPELHGFPDFKPKIEGVLESAPAYEPLLKVTAVPLLYGCVYSIAKDKCSCYTQQATPYPASKSYCMETVKNHRFNPYYERVPSSGVMSGHTINLPDKSKDNQQIAKNEIQ